MELGKSVIPVYIHPVNTTAIIEASNELHTKVKLNPFLITLALCHQGHVVAQLV
jgi:hypothetical protein